MSTNKKITEASKIWLGVVLSLILLALLSACNRSTPTQATGVTPDSETSRSLSTTGTDDDVNRWFIPLISEYLVADVEPDPPQVCGVNVTCPPDFNVTTTYSAAEPKLVVSLADLEVTALEKLEYRLERFSNQCNDSGTILTGEVALPSTSNPTFDIPTVNYGAFKLSVTATYQASAYGNPVKTILPDAPSLADLPTDVDLSGLVYVEILDNHVQNMADQIHVPDADGFMDFFVFNFQKQLQALTFADSISGNTGIHQVHTTINLIGTEDRKWCGLGGVDLVSKNAKGFLQDPDDDFVPYKNPEGFQQIFQNSASDPVILKLIIEPQAINGPDTIFGDRAPFVFFNLVVNEYQKDANGQFIRDSDNNLIIGDEIYNEEHFVQDCATVASSELSEVSFDLGPNQTNRCFLDNDFPR